MRTPPACIIERVPDCIPARSPWAEYASPAASINPLVGVIQHGSPPMTGSTTTIVTVVGKVAVNADRLPPEINVVDWRFQRRDRSVSALLCGTCSLADQDFQAVTPQEGRAPLVKLPHWRVRQFVARTLAPTPNGFEADPLSITSFRDVRQQNWMPASSFRVSKQRHGKKSLRDWPR